MPSHDENEKSSQSQDERTDQSEALEKPLEVTYPPLLEYLQSKEGHELASRIVSLLEAIQKATIETSAEQRKREVEFHHSTVRLWLKLQSGVIAIIIVSAVALAWHGKLDATVAALMGTLFGYFLGRPLR